MFNSTLQLRKDGKEHFGEHQLNCPTSIAERSAQNYRETANTEVQSQA
jgi:hypothetical protein